MSNGATVQRLASQLNGVANCPHCGIANPQLPQVWHSGEMVPRADGGSPRRWAAYRCTSCGSIVLAEGSPQESTNNPMIVRTYPETWEPSEYMPERAKNYIRQARLTLAAPDASVVMSAASIDAMLKDQGLKEGSLFKRIDLAVEKGILTSGMAKWAHQTRIDSNNPRHADEDCPHLSADDARRALDYAKALAEIIYILPSRMPTDDRQ